MPQKRCPNCNKIVTFMPHTGDFVHECDSGNLALDQEDFLAIGSPGWNLNGIENKASVGARADGENVDNYTVRGNRKGTHFSRQHSEYIEIKEDD